MISIESMREINYGDAKKIHCFIIISINFSNK